MTYWILPPEDVRLELIPLIDVIFCILTFFILAAVGLTRQQAIDLDLPSAETGQPIPGQVGQGGISDRLYVSIDSLGQNLSRPATRYPRFALRRAAAV